MGKTSHNFRFEEELYHPFRLYVIKVLGYSDMTEYFHSHFKETLKMNEQISFDKIFVDGEPITKPKTIRSRWVEYIADHIIPGEYYPLNELHRMGLPVDRPSDRTMGRRMKDLQRMESMIYIIRGEYAGQYRAVDPTKSKQKQLEESWILGRFLMEKNVWRSNSDVIAWVADRLEEFWIQEPDQKLSGDLIIRLFAKKSIPVGQTEVKELYPRVLDELENRGWEFGSKPEEE